MRLSWRAECDICWGLLFELGIYYGIHLTLIYLGMFVYSISCDCKEIATSDLDLLFLSWLRLYNSILSYPILCMHNHIIIVALRPSHWSALKCIELCMYLLCGIFSPNNIFVYVCMYVLTGVKVLTILSSVWETKTHWVSRLLSKATLALFTFWMYRKVVSAASLPRLAWLKSCFLGHCAVGD